MNAAMSDIKRENGFSGEVMKKDEILFLLDEDNAKLSELYPVFRDSTPVEWTIEGDSFVLSGCGDPIRWSAWNDPTADTEKQIRERLRRILDHVL